MVSEHSVQDTPATTVTTLDDIRDWLHNWDAVYFRLAQGPPRQHGNGFFQLDLYNGYRIHVWDPDAPSPQQPATPIHDHRFSFRSQVLIGVQGNLVYEVSSHSETPTHRVYTAVPDDRENSKLVPTGLFETLALHYQQTIRPGQEYTLKMGQFHETPNGGYVVTLLKKTRVDPQRSPRVLCPIDKTPDHEFSRYSLPKADRWNVLERAIKKFTGR